MKLFTLFLPHACMSCSLIESAEKVFYIVFGFSIAASVYFVMIIRIIIKYVKYKALQCGRTQTKLFYV